MTDARAERIASLATTGKTDSPAQTVASKERERDVKWSEAEPCLKRLEGHYHRLSRLAKAMEAELAEPDDQEGLGEEFLRAARLVLESAATQKRIILKEMEAIEDTIDDE